jgi:hypothetical protein
MNTYINSQKYPLEDKTNRHGILHGTYTDNDYGFPINYYKIISAIDFLCFAISIHHGGRWWLSNNPLESSEMLYSYLKGINIVGVHRKTFKKEFNIVTKSKEKKQT